MYSVASIIADVYFQYAKMVDINVLITYTKVAEGLEMITTLIVVIISQCMHIWKAYCIPQIYKFYWQLCIIKWDVGRKDFKNPILRTSTSQINSPELSLIQLPLMSGLDPSASVLGNASFCSQAKAYLCENLGSRLLTSKEGGDTKKEVGWNVSQQVTMCQSCHCCTLTFSWLMRGATAPSNQNMARNELRETGVSAYAKEFAESLPGSFKCFTLLFLHLQNKCRNRWF